MSDASVVMTNAGLKENDFQLAVYDKLDRFGYRLYSFKKEDADKILNNANGVLAQFRGRTARVKGIEIELLDGNGDIVSTEEFKVTLPFLLTDSVVRNNVWAFHPSILSYMGMYSYVPLYIENKAVTIPLRFELPAEFQDITAEINTKLIYEDDFAEASVKTRNALHNAAINLLAKGSTGAKAELSSLAETDYPLAEAARDSVEANEILNTSGLLLEEYVNRLEPIREKGNYSALQATAITYESMGGNYETQKKAVPYITQAAMVHPEAMIRMGEVYEQGFYDVKPNPKKAEFYYKEGIRILSLLAAQGLPSAAVALGHVYIEGLGTKQDIPRAERFYKFAEKSGYTDPEYMFWIHFGATLRQVTIPEKLKESITRNWNELDDARTCMYLIREKACTPVALNRYYDILVGICNRRPVEFFSRFKYNENKAEYYRNNNAHEVRAVAFYTQRRDNYWEIDLHFNYK